MQTLLSRRTFDPTVESVIVALSDEIAQVCHDLSDAVDADTISFHELKQQLDSHIQVAAPFLAGTGQEFQFGTSVDDRLPNNRKFCSMLISWFTISTALEIANQLLEHDPSTPVADVLSNLPSTPCPPQHFSAVKRFKDDLAINNFNVNRTDNKGRYIIRQLYHAYIEDPRQLPDADLKRYLFLKQKELQARRSDGILEWLTHANAVLTPDSRLSPQDHQQIIDVIQGGQAITFFRTGDAAFINRITPVLFQDADYVRTIVDYIAAMTDIFAENEMVCLYG
jgi:dGTP triphosphohydrolase